MKYLKKFNTENDRSAYENGESYIEPYVSYVDGGDVHYNKVTVETRLIVTYNVTDTSNPALLFIGAESMGFPASTIYDKIEIDNVEINMSDLSSSEEEGMTFYSYQLTNGEHTVKYTLKDPTMIGAEIDEETHMPSKLGAMFIDCPIISVEIPNSVTSIGVSAFGGCTSLTNVTIPNSVTSIGLTAFYNCSGITSITIPSGVTSIDNNAFGGCSSLTSIIIPSGVTSIGNDTFYFCTSLTSVTIGNGVTSIGVGAFHSCSGLTSVNIPSGVTTIGNTAFGYCSGLTSVTLGNNLTSIGNFAFQDCKGLTSVTIPNSVTSIGESAFYECSSLLSVTIGNSVTSIGHDAFRSCSSLTSVTIGNSVTSIGNAAFYECINLTSVVSLATTTPTIQSNTFLDVKTNGTLYVPTGSNYSTWMSYLPNGWTKVEQ